MTDNKKFQKLSCSPESDNNYNFSCYDQDDLTKLKIAYNKRHKGDPIVSDDPKKIWETLRYRYHNVCDKESCWLRQNFANNKLGNELIHSFAPKQPSSWKKNDRTWLSSNEINQVMKQYENKYKCFEFIGPSPIDYDTYDDDNNCIWPELCHFNINDKLKKRKFKIGIIFNLDKHDQPGSHWVSLFIHLKNKKIYYFDSVKSNTTTNTVPPEILRFVKKIQDQGNNMNVNYDFEYNNKIAHQTKNTECGMYSLYFIINMLKDLKTWDNFMKLRIKDDDVHKFRKIYFNQEI
jgi:hypothetical protein